MQEYYTSLIFTFVVSKMSGGGGRNFLPCDLGMLTGIFLALQRGGKVSTVRDM